MKQEDDMSILKKRSILTLVAAGLVAVAVSGLTAAWTIAEEKNEPAEFKPKNRWIFLIPAALYKRWFA